MSTNRGKNPKQITVMKLVAAAGGRCQFEGCTCNLFTDNITWAELNQSNVAHIVASSPNGPRGSEDSEKLSDKLSNLMLLCPTHHKEIDSDPNSYPVDRLRQMKQAQEEKVNSLLEGMYFGNSEILILESPIKGKVDIHVDKLQCIVALRSNKYNPASSVPVKIRLDSFGEYSSSQYWQILTAKLSAEVEKAIFSRFQFNPELRVAVFPMAPIPLIAKLGELLGDKRGVDVFQKTREPDTWCWQNEDQTNFFRTERLENDNGDNEKVAIILSLTADINESRVKNGYNAGTIYHIHAKRNGVDCISSLNDLKLFWKEYQKICDQIKNNDKKDNVALFPAVPVSAAFEIGRRHMPGVHPVLHIYDDDNGFFEALTIGGKN